MMYTIEFNNNIIMVLNVMETENLNYVSSVRHISIISIRLGWMDVQWLAGRREYVDVIEKSQESKMTRVLFS